MAIVGGLDIHRRQITFDYLDTMTGETRRGQLSPASRLEVRAWLAQFQGQPASFALEATTGWRYVVEELTGAGIDALRWIAILCGHVDASLAATTGVHTRLDAAKVLLAGADVAMMTSALLRHGPEHVRKVERELLGILAERGYAAITQLRGA
jgi:hypothetical protein